MFGSAPHRSASAFWLQIKAETPCLGDRCPLHPNFNLGGRISCTLPGKSAKSVCRKDITSIVRLKGWHRSSVIVAERCWAQRLARDPRGSRITKNLSESRGSFCNLPGCCVPNRTVPARTRGDGDQGEVKIRLSASAPKLVRYRPIPRTLIKRKHTDSGKTPWKSSGHIQQRPSFVGRRKPDWFGNPREVLMDGWDQAVSRGSRAGRVRFLDLHPNLRSFPRFAAVGLVIRGYCGPRLSPSRSTSLVPADR